MSDYFDCQRYLEYYWPEHPESTEMMGENLFLINEYREAVEYLQKTNGDKKYRCLDISSGPVLAPTIVFAPILQSVQLSEFSPTNRSLLLNNPLNYWTVYTKAILQAENNTNETIEERLKNVKQLVEEKPVLAVDIKSEKMFSQAINSNEYDLITMHFVADSITNDRQEYGQMLDRVCKLVKPGNTLVMSALIECSEWDMEDGHTYPSPNLKLNEIAKELENRGLKVIRAKQREEIDGDLGHDGSLGVITAVREA